MPAEVRVLLLADSHLGFDLPARPRVERRRRGHDFLANYAAALAPAFAGEVDVVVHGGDVFDRPRVPLAVAYAAFEPLRRLASGGVPVLIVPGNHERGRLPHARLAVHPGVYVFDRPRTFALTVRGTMVAFTGFPYERRNVRARFAELLERAGWGAQACVLRLLCVHHCFEGATVGPGDFTFTRGDDVIRGCDVPAECAAVLTGHVHRHQVLTTDVHGRRLSAPILYPGSLERTSYAEVGETKGYMLVRFAVRDAAAGLAWEFRGLPARPLVRCQVDARLLSPDGLEQAIRRIVARQPEDAVVAIHMAGDLSDAHLRRVSARHLRTFVPSTMNVDIVSASGRVQRTRRGASQMGRLAARPASRPDERRSRSDGRRQSSAACDAQLEVALD